MTKNGRRKACSVITADFPDPGALPHTNHRELTEYTWLHRANSNLKWLSCRRIGHCRRWWNVARSRQSTAYLPFSVNSPRMVAFLSVEACFRPLGTHESKEKLMITPTAWVFSYASSNFMSAKNASALSQPSSSIISNAKFRSLNCPNTGSAFAAKCSKHFVVRS